MSVLLYGGGFNPPHPGHVSAAECAYALVRPKHFLVIPDGQPPHKPLPEGTPEASERLELCRLAFRDCPWAEISDLAVSREGPCYMIDTVRLLRQRYPDQELILLVGTDMLLCFESWYRAEELLRECTLCAICRDKDQEESLWEAVRHLRERYGAKTLILPHKALPCSSSRIRELLPLRQGRALLDGEVYRRIVQGRFYGAKPELSWLREQVYAMLPRKRIPHVQGCEQEARRLAERWGLDPDAAAEAGILHDMTKRWTTEEQLAYCDSRGIPLEKGERENPQLLHARTGAVAAKEFFGAPESVCRAIRWHTTGRPEMDAAEKVLYLADMIEPNRDFPGLDRLRELAYSDLDAAMAEALSLSVESIRRRNMYVYKDTLAAYRWYAVSPER